MKKSWLSMNKATKEVSLSDKAKDSIEDTVAVLLTKVVRSRRVKATWCLGRSARVRLPL